jgi:inorganic pyrophosphatase
MPDYTRLPIGEKAPHRINAVIEIPKDSVNKYEYDKQLHVFKLDRTCFPRCIIPAITDLFLVRSARMVIPWMY